MVLGRRRVLGIGLVACALSAGGCGSDDAKSEASGGSPNTGGAAGAGGQGGAAGAAGTGGAVSCDTPPAATGDAKFDAVAKWFFDKSVEWKVPGGALVVYADGKLHKMTFGSKKATVCEPVGEGTRFGLTRASHFLTSLAAVRMSLDASSGIDLDKPIVEYMPELIEHLNDVKSKERGKKVTLRHLLSNTSGYWPVNWGYGACPDVTPPAARVEGPESLAAFFVPNQASIVHEPGEMWMGGDLAVTLAARVLEIATKKQFAALMKERLADPSGLGLTFDAAEAEAGDYAHAIVTGCGVTAPSWGAYASVNDIGKLVASLAAGGGDGVLSKQEVALNSDAGPSVVAPVKGMKTGMGWHNLPFPPYGTVSQRGAGANNTNGHSASATVVFVPEKQFGLAIVGNVDPGLIQFDQAREHILKEYFPDSKAYDHSRDPTTWGEYAGKYQGDDGTLAEVQVVGKELKLTITGNNKDAEYMLSPGGFVYWGIGTEQGDSIDEDWFERTGLLFRPAFRFYRNASGQPTAIGGWISEFAKAPIPGPFTRIVP